MSERPSLICLNCENTSSFSEVELPVVQEFRGVELRVESPVTVCQMCGFELLSIGQADILVKRTKDAYERHLLTKGDCKL